MRVGGKSNPPLPSVDELATPKKGRTFREVRAALAKRKPNMSGDGQERAIRVAQAFQVAFSKSIEKPVDATLASNELKFINALMQTLPYPNGLELLNGLKETQALHGVESQLDSRIKHQMARIDEAARSSRAEYERQEAMFQTTQDMRRIHANRLKQSGDPRHAPSFRSGD